MSKIIQTSLANKVPFSTLLLLAWLGLRGPGAQAQQFNQAFPDKQVWLTIIPHGVPDYEDAPTIVFGADYPLDLRPSYSTPRWGGETYVQRIARAGFTGLQWLVNEENLNTVESWMGPVMTDADQFQGRFLMAPQLAPGSKETTLNMIQQYVGFAGRHVSAARLGGKLVVCPYATTELSVADWQWVRAQLTRQGVAVYLLSDMTRTMNPGSNSNGTTQQVITEYSAMTDGFYLFGDDRYQDFGAVAQLLNSLNKPYAGGIMPGYDRETVSNGGYGNAYGTDLLRASWQGGLDHGLQWQTVNTWNDVVEHTDMHPSSEWNWTRADVNAFYSAKLRGVAPPFTTPQLYVTTPQLLRLGESPRAEALVLNPTSGGGQVRVQLYDGDGQPYGAAITEALTPEDATAATIPASTTVTRLPARGFLRARAWLYDASGTLLQSVTSAPVLVYEANRADVPVLDYTTPKQTRTLYYSIPAARALAGSVGLWLTGPVVEGGTAQAVVTPPAGAAVRFAEVLQNTREVEHRFGNGQTSYAVAVPRDNARMELGKVNIFPPAADGFYVARVIDEQERVGYSDPVQVRPDGSVVVPTPALASAPASAAASDLAVFPNPVSERLRVQLPAAAQQAGTLRLCDNLGRAVRQQALAAGTRQTEVDVHGLPAGLYLLRVQQGPEVRTHKVVVQP